MTNSGRLKDLSDVLELIKTLALPIDFADRLDPFVQDKFKELWKVAEQYGSMEGADDSGLDEEGGNKES
jgi:hypothetical protein